MEEEEKRDQELYALEKERRDRRFSADFEANAYSPKARFSPKTHLSPNTHLSPTSTSSSSSEEYKYNSFGTTTTAPIEMFDYAAYTKSIRSFPRRRTLTDKITP